MEEKYLQDKWRMYGLTPYNLSPIQKGIQFGHAVVEYMVDFGQHDHTLDWANNNKTFIILNGGTTNDTPGRLGTLNMHLQTMKDFLPNWSLATFNEPDLGDQLTAFVFLVPEQVYNKTDYPDFEDSIKTLKQCIGMDDNTRVGYAGALKEEGHEVYKAWLKSMGGQDNVMMREFLNQFNLAN